MRDNGAQRTQTDPWTSSFSTEISANAAQLFITDLKPLHAYDVRVTAVNALGESEPSKAVAFASEEEVSATRLPKVTSL